MARLARLDAGPDEAVRFGHGQAIDFPGDSSGDIAVFGPGGRFLGVASRLETGRIAPLRLMSAADAKHPDFA